MNIKIGPTILMPLLNAMATQQEVWLDKKYTPDGSVGGLIKFYQGGQIFATAVISKIEPPTELQETWRVYWTKESFKLRKGIVIDQGMILRGEQAV